MEAFRQGLLLSLYGVGATFLVLGALIALIRVLQLLFPVPPPGDHPTDEAEPTEEEAHAAAVAAAWWYLNQRGDGQLGNRLTEKRGRWWEKKKFTRHR